MIIRTVSFDPIIVLVDGVQSPIVEVPYKDENGVDQKISFVVSNGEKIPIQHKADLFEFTETKKVDDALDAIEVKRLENEDKKEVKP